MSKLPPEDVPQQQTDPEVVNMFVNGRLNGRRSILSFWIGPKEPATTIIWRGQAMYKVAQAIVRHWEADS